MTERSRIEERLRKKEQEIKASEEKIREAKIYIQALRDILRMMDKAHEAESSPDTSLKPGSMVAQAREILLARREPVHVDELLEELGKETTRESRASLTGSLAAYVRRQEIFSRPAPNTFGLLELEHSEAIGANRQPPPGFGHPTEIDPDEDIPF